MRSTLILSLFLCALARSGPAGELGPRVFPNPISASDPDAVNRVMHVDQVDAGSVMSVYNMIGEKIYSRALKGNGDPWDLVNSNGGQAPTGVYIVLNQPPSGKSSVQRIAILQ